jgi:alpha-beta hydrolase superfamily lysophospholipase
MHTSTLSTTDGLSLQLRHWPLEGGAPARGSVLIVHGLGEHAGRYAHVAAHLNANAWRAIGFDLRGHGQSGGARGALARPDSLLDDLAQVIEAVRREHPGPLVLLGHSMGGLIAGRFVAEGLAAQPAMWWRPVDALVMSSPALDPGMNAFQKGLLAVLGPLAPNLAVNNGLDPAWISRDPAVVKAYVDDPLVHDRITPRLARFIVDGGELVRQRAAGWTLPTALLYAGADRCVAPRGSDAFAAAAPHSVVHSRRYDGFSHEIFNEPEQREVLAELSRWLAPHGTLNG